MESDVQHWWKPLSLTDALFYPTEQTLKNFLAKAKNRFHFSNGDVESLTTSIQVWLESHRQDSIFFQPPSPSNNDDFILVVQTAHQREMLMKYGLRCFGIDATYKPNRYDFALFSVVVLDEFQAN